MKPSTILIDGDYCEPSFPLLDEKTLFVGCNKTRRGMIVNDNSDAVFIAVDILTQQQLWTYKFDTSKRKQSKVPYVNNVITTPLLWNGRIIIASNYELVCLHQEDGTKIWSIPFSEMADIKLSIIDQNLYYTNGKMLCRAAIDTGKTLVKGKDRVKWLDSPLVSYKGRRFVATGSSKILELAADTLEIINEFPYGGNWAIAETPFFYDDLMISSSYAGEVIAFNLSSNQPEWKIKKKAGAKPFQIASAGNAIFYDSITDSLLRSIDLKNKKTIWSQKLDNVEAVRIRNDDEFLAVYQSGTHTYDLVMFSFLTGKLMEQLTNETPLWKEYPFGLWNGIAILENKAYIISNFKPNEITVIEK